MIKFINLLTNLSLFFVSVENFYLEYELKNFDFLYRCKTLYTFFLPNLKRASECKIFFSSFDPKKLVENDEQKIFAKFLIKILNIFSVRSIFMFLFLYYCY